MGIGGCSRKATKFDIYFSEIGICRLVFLDLSWGVPNSVRYFCRVSPWYNRTGWLGVKHQLTYWLTSVASYSLSALEATGS